MFLKISTLRELCTTSATFVWFIPSVDGHGNSNYSFLRIVQHMYHIYMVCHQCGYRHVSLKYHLLRIVHHRYHICTVYPVWIRMCVFTLQYLVGIVHHRYHLDLVCQQCGCGHQTKIRYKTCATMSHFNRLLIVQVFTFTATLKTFPLRTFTIFIFFIFTTAWMHTCVFNVILRKTLRHNQECIQDWKYSARHVNQR